MRPAGPKRVVIVGPHPPAPSAAARLCARLAAEHARSGAEVLTVDRLPSAADRAVPLRGLAGAVAVARLARGADHLELVLEPCLVQRDGARSLEHRAVAVAWGVALRVPRSARIHVLDLVDLRQLELDLDGPAPAGLEIVAHVAVVDPTSPAPPAGDRPGGEAKDPGTTWEAFGAHVAVRASADRLAGLSLRLPLPTPPPTSRNQQVVDHLRSRYGRPGHFAVQVVLSTKRLGRTVLEARGRRPGGS